MSHPSFDTHEYAKELKQAGVSEEVIEVEVKYAKRHRQVLNDLIDEKLATKADLEKLNLSLKSDLEKLRLELQLEMQSIKGDLQSLAIKLTSILGAVVVATGGVMTTILSFLMHH